MLRRYYGKISKLPIDQFIGHDGELVVDDLTGRTYVMDGVTLGGTELVGATPRFGSTPPDNPTPGALWYDPESGRTYIYYQSQWVDAAPNTTYVLPPVAIFSNAGNDYTDLNSLWGGSPMVLFNKFNSDTSLTIKTSEPETFVGVC